ncbi:MAG: M50 family metallopeptidase [Candidatus Nanogingivalaceae bacterium]|nr:M50 family metallopeptidase [Candidatus Nanogingivalaceae bacterium]
MSIIFGIIIGIIVLTILVVTHELGHALVARRCNVRVEEFGIGFPPAAYKKKVKKSFLGKNVNYSVNWLPLGGFVKLQGEHDDDKKPGDYGAATFWQKTQILLAGVAVNWLSAVLVFTVLAWWGMPPLVQNQFTVASDTVTSGKEVKIAGIENGLPAQKSGLKAGDDVLSVNGDKVKTPDELTKRLAREKGKTVEIRYSRNGREATLPVALRSNNNDKRGYLGASLSQEILMRSTWSAPVVGVGLTTQLTGLTIQGLGQVVYDGVIGLAMKIVPNDQAQQQANQKLATVGNSVGGPVTIFGMLFPAAGEAGGRYVLMIAGLIALSLAVMNILPIPALDGGRWFVTALFHLIKKPLNKYTEEKIHGIGFLILMVLVVLITISDVGKLFR